MKKFVWSLLFVLLPDTAFADSTSVATNLSVNAEMKVYYSATPGLNSTLRPGWRLNDMFGPYVFGRVTQGRGDIFAGGLVYHGDNFAGIGIGAVGSDFGAQLIAQYEYKLMTAKAQTELSANRWQRYSAVFKTSPATSLGAFYQTGVGFGPRGEWHLPQTTATFWGCFNVQGTKEVFGFNYRW